jgi:hypothetical protein
MLLFYLPIYLAVSALYVVCVLHVIRYFLKLFTDKHPNHFIRVFRGVEPLSDIFWKYGVVGYPVFTLAMHVLISFGNQNFIGLFEFSNRGFTHEWLITIWCALAIYRVIWACAIYKSYKNTEQKSGKYLAVAIAFMITFFVVQQMMTVVSMPSLDERQAQCLAMKDRYKALGAEYCVERSVDKYLPKGIFYLY